MALGVVVGLLEPPVPLLGFCTPPVAVLPVEFDVPPALGLLLVVLFAPPDVVVVFVLDLVPLPPTAAELSVARVPPAEREFELFDVPPAVSSVFAVPPASPPPSSLPDAEAPPLPVAASDFVVFPPFAVAPLFVEVLPDPPTFDDESFEGFPPAPWLSVPELSLGIAVPSSPPLQAVVESAYVMAAK